MQHLAKTVWVNIVKDAALMVHFDVNIIIIASFNLIGLSQGWKPIGFPLT